MYVRLFVVGFWFSNIDSLRFLKASLVKFHVLATAFQNVLFTLHGILSQNMTSLIIFYGPLVFLQYELSLLFMLLNMWYSPSDRDFTCHDYPTFHR